MLADDTRTAPGCNAWLQVADVQRERARSGGPRRSHPVAHAPDRAHSAPAMIVDCHTHLNRYGASERATLAERRDALRAVMDAHAIDYALVLASYRVGEDRPTTERLVDLLEGDARIGVVAGVRFATDRAAQVASLRALLEAGRLKGLKLYPGYEPFYVHDAGLREVYRLAAEFRVPVMIHTGDTFDRAARVKYAHPLAVDEVAVEHPDVTFVICHAGNPWFVDAMEVIYKNANVVADISGLTLGTMDPRFERFVRDRLRDLVAYVNDPTRLMFGSDWPLADVGSHLRLTEQLELSSDEREALLWRNADRVFGLGLQSASQVTP